MSELAIATNIEGKRSNFQINTYPDECPICHIALRPRFICAIYHGANPPDCQLELIFQCPRIECGHLFISAYLLIGEISTFLHSEPIYPEPHPFPDEIKKISPTFVEVYNQAIAAESHNLTELTGIGLRKALEFLIKDYAISQNPDEEEEKIKNTWLGECIKKFIDDPKIKVCAERAVWLANDETHYLRKWEDKDITDLKVLVKLTVNWIESCLLTEQYEDDMK